MTKFLRYPELRDRGIGYSPSSLYRLEAKGLFPRRRKLGPRLVGWVESEIEAHTAKLAKAAG
jgi:prophage regulatory protein